MRPTTRFRLLTIAILAAFAPLFDDGPSETKSATGPGAKTKALAHPGRLTCKASKTGEMVVEGYASVFNVLDSDNDIVLPGAYRRTIEERFKANLIKLCYQHNPLQPIGKFVEMEEDEVGLRFKAVLADTPTAREAYALMKAGVIDRFSIGYDVVKHRKGTAKELGLDLPADKTVRMLDELKLYEVSPVTFAANESATLTAVKRRNLWVTVNRKEMTTGSFVAWPGPDGDVYGRVTAVATSGDVTTDNGPLAATADDPVATIVVYAPEGDGWVETDEVVHLQLSGLSEIDPLMEPTTDAASADEGGGTATTEATPDATASASPGTFTLAAKGNKPGSAKAMAVVRQRIEVGTRVSWRMGALELSGAVQGIVESGEVTMTDPLVLAAMWSKGPVTASPDCPVLTVKLDDGTTVTIPTYHFGVTIEATAVTTAEPEAPKRRKADPSADPMTSTTDPAATTDGVGDDAPDEDNPNEYQPSEDIVATAAEAVAEIDGGASTDGIDETVIDLGRRIASGAALSSADVESGARLWVTRGEEMLTATDGPAFLVAALLGGTEGETWFLRSFATATIRGGTSPAQGEASDDGAAEAKGGRILSQRNMTRLESALKLVKDVVDDEKRRGRSTQKPKTIGGQPSMLQPDAVDATTLAELKGLVRTLRS